MKKILALILALSLVFAFAACGKGDNTPTQPIETTTDEFAMFEAEFEDIEDDGSAETEAATPETSDVSADAGATQANGETVAASGATEAPAKAAPSTTAEIIEAYNNAINSAYNAKAGFDKERKTDNENIAGGGVVFSAAKDLVYKFMGVGDGNIYSENVAKGQWESEPNMHYLRKSTLTAADVTKATCKEGNGKYLIVLEVKDGSSRGSKEEKFTNAPIDKCGICVGTEDKGYYDHKTGEVIYDALAGTYAGADISEKYTNAKVSAIIDAQTGNIISLKVEFDIDVAIDIDIAKGTATATTHITYKNFKY